MTVPATIDIVTASIGVLVGLLVLGMSRGPGLRGLRWFAVASFCASGYAIVSTPISLGASDGAIIWGSRASLFFGGLHGVCWFPYSAHAEGRPLRLFDVSMMTAGVSFALLALVPNALVGSTVSELAISWLGATYRDAHPTLLGEVCYGFYCFGLLVIASRLWRRGINGDANALGQALGFAALLATGVSDSLTAARLWAVPYLLNLGFLCVVVSVGAMIVSRFVANARELERSSKQLREAQERLLARERLAAVGELSAIVAHEVRNPLGVIYNVVAQLRRNRAADAETGSLLTMLQEEAERLSRMVGALLDFARPNQPEYRRLALEPLLSSATDSVVSVSQDHAAEVQVEIAPGTPDLHADEQMIRQAVINLVDNALQAPDRRGPVLVRAEPSASGREVRIVVADDGAGVPAGLEQRIFTPFFTTRAQGTGLGLAIVHRIAEAHRGTVRLEQGPGRGATFVLTVKAAEPELQRRAG